MGIDEVVSSIISSTERTIPLSRSGLTSVDRLVLKDGIKIKGHEAGTIIRKTYHRGKGSRGYDHINTRRRLPFRGPGYYFDTERTVLDLMKDEGKVPILLAHDEKRLELYIEDLLGHDLLFHIHGIDKNLELRDMKSYMQALRDFQRNLQDRFSQIEDSLSSTPSRNKNPYGGGIPIPRMSELTYAARLIRTIISEYALTRSIRKGTEYKSRFRAMVDALNKRDYDLEGELKEYIDGYSQLLFGAGFFSGKRKDIIDILLREKDHSSLYSAGFGLAHGDMSPGNILLADNRLLFVDLDSIRVDNMFVDMAYLINSLVYCRGAAEGKGIEQENLGLIKADHKYTSSDLDLEEYITRYVTESVDSHLRLIARFIWFNKSKIKDICNGLNRAHHSFYAEKLEHTTDTKRVLLGEIYKSLKGMLEFYLRGKGFKEYKSGQLYTHLSGVEKFLTTIEIGRLFQS